MKKFKSFGECLKSLLEEAMLSQAELARKMGLSSSQIAHYIKDRYQPSTQRVKQFERAIGRGFTILRKDDAWYFTQDLMKSLHSLNESPLDEQLKASLDKKRTALHQGFEEAIKLASLMKQNLEEVKHESPFDLGYMFAVNLELSAIAYRDSLPKNVEDTTES